MKLGIVFEGGASRSLFSCGAMDAFLDHNIYADYVIGVSAGIAYGTSYVSKQKGRNLELATKYMRDKRYMGFRHLLNRKNGSYYNRSFAFGQIPEELVPYDFDAFDRYEGTAIATLTNIETGEAEYLTIPPHNHKKHIDILWASCALPFMFKPEIIDGKIYMDGGISDPIPFRKALDDGCDKLIVVLTREPSYFKAKEASATPAKLFYRKYPKLSEALKKRAKKYNQSRKEIFHLAEEKKIYVICPTNTVGFRRTEKDPEKLRNIYADGYNITSKNIESIKKYIYE